VDQQEVSARRFDAQGNTEGPEFRVNTYQAGPQSNPFVAAKPNGAFMVTWFSGFNQDGDNEGVFAQRYHAVDIIFADDFDP
jgi:hypothetical protein